MRIVVQRISFARSAGLKLCCILQQGFCFVTKLLQETALDRNYCGACSGGICGVWGCCVPGDVVWFEKLVEGPLEKPVFVPEVPTPLPEPVVGQVCPGGHCTL